MLLFEPSSRWSDLPEAALPLPEFDLHEEMISLENRSLGVTGYIAIHRKREGVPSLGATRIWSYPTKREAVQDALRLSRLMTYKAAFAGLPYGGAKAILTTSPDISVSRSVLFSWYAEMINALDGRFVTGSDVGMGYDDVKTMREKSRFVIGAGVPAGYYTALGVVEAIRAALEELYGSADISGRTFAVQGLGKTGRELVRLLHGSGARIYVADIDKDKTRQAEADFPGVLGVSSTDIHKAAVDIFSPCALHHSVNALTAPELGCKAIVGSANNQMESEVVESLVYDRGIVYAVDFVANSGGLLSVVDEYEHEGQHSHERIIRALIPMRKRLKEVFLKSRLEHLPSGIVARRMAESFMS